MKTPLDFRNEVLGKRFDIDGYYGAQCWDGYAHYMKWLGYPYANCTASNYVKDIWEQRNSNSMLNSCIEVEVMQQGDIAIFKEVAGITPYSHIAIFMEDLGNGYGRFLGQNQGGYNGAFNEAVFPYSATYATALRPKCYKDLIKKPETPVSESIVNSIPSDFRYEKAAFTVTADTPITIRRAPSTKGVDTGLTYNKGMSVNYDGYVVREGYVWISWISANDGTRRWMSCGKANAQGYNIEPWGKFR